MKTNILSSTPIVGALLIFVLLPFGAGVCLGQAQATASSASTSSGYAIVQRSASSRMWATITSQTNDAGQVSLVTNNAYTELASGLCFQSNGIWLDSVEQIDVVADGAAATQAPHNVHFAPNANTAGGAIHLVTSDGKVFDSRVYGLGYWDSASGKSVLLAPLQDSQGVLVGNNRIVYADAFQGVKADIEYVFTKAGLEQNIILRAQIPSPDSLATGLSPVSSRLQVLTEFFSPPVPQKKSRVVNGIQEDLLLNFGATAIGMGKAFYTKGEGQPKVGVFGRVSKHWTQMEGRDFLIEEIPYPAISNVIQTLPPQASASPVKAGVSHLASLEPLLPQEMASVWGAEARIWGPEVTALMPPVPEQPGLVLDYVLFNNGADTDNFVFQNDTTYYVSGSLSIEGQGTFEGGSVIKILTELGCINNYGDSPLIFNGSAYLPTVFTSMDDNSVGATILDSTGNPMPGTAQYIYEQCGAEEFGVTIAHARFSYAGGAYEDDADYSHLFQDCQFLKCGSSGGAICLPQDWYLYFYNVLFSDCTPVLEGCGYDAHLEGGGGWFELDGENITVDSTTAFATTAWNCYGGSGGITNSILTACDSSISDFTLAYSSVASSGTSIYQTVGAGSYYLANGSTNRGTGTTSINSALLADLKTKTTYPPVVIEGGWITDNTTLFPQAQRDTGSPPDRGYHYDSIDYALNLAISNATVTVLPGTALAGYGTEYGVNLYSNATFNCQGTASSPNYFVPYNAVQEQSNTNWEWSAWTGLLCGPAGLDSSSENFVFTVWTGLAGETFYDSWNADCPLDLQNCQFYGGSIYAYGSAMLSTNCLYRRVYLNLHNQAPSGFYTSNAFFNNLFWQGTITGTRYFRGTYEWPGTWTFCDNLFDSATNTVLTTNTDICSNNAYVTTNFGILAYGANNVVLTTSPAYETGDLGVYYYPTSLTNLIHEGSRSAPAAGLYHYTVLTNNTVDGTNLVSIGFHYVACGTNGLPLSTPGDGIPDYIADANGNGIVDAGEISWTNYVSPNGLTTANGLMVFTPLK